MLCVPNYNIIPELAHLLSLREEILKVTSSLGSINVQDLELEDELFYRDNPFFTTLDNLEESLSKDILNIGSTQASYAKEISAEVLSKL